MTRIAVVDYGVGNLRSAEKALQHVGADARLTASAADVGAADGVVVPGVGAFAGSLRALEESGLTEVVRDVAVGARDSTGVPYLGICVGLQMLFDESEENPGVTGLGVLPGAVASLSRTEKLPQMQWNRMMIDGEHRLFAGLGARPWCYYVHSYAAPVGAYTIAHCDYGGSVCAALGTGRLVATQFHPEKSGHAGLKVLANFASLCAGAA